MSMKNKRIAILGAGPSGLAQLRAFEALRKKGEEIPELVCYEKQDDWGGMWRYSWEVGVDQNGEPVHGSMYRFLWSNAPKEAIEFGDYTFDDHFKKPMPSYLPREVLLDYILGRVKQSDVKRYIHFNHAVRWIEYDPEREKFTVTVMDHTKDELKSEEFDHVVIATGHFSTPYYPDIKGLERFPGRVLHSHDYRDPREFAGRRLLIVGSSYSAEDIGSQCYKYGADEIIFSYLEGPMPYDWPDNIRQRPLIEYVDENKVHFVDGSVEEVDAILFCTGFKFHFPYLPEELRLKSRNELYLSGLYNGVALIKEPKLFYLGMQNHYYTFNMFDAQAWYVRELILGRQKLPDEETMERETEAWLKELAEQKGHPARIDFQARYIQHLLDMSDYPEIKIKEQGDIIKEWIESKSEGILNFRDRCYRSTITGTLAAKLPKPWMEMMDDSLESFMKLEFEPSE